MFFDPIQVFYPIPALAVVLWAIRRVKSVETAASRDLRLNGNEAASKLMDAAGRSSVSVRNVDGSLTDFLDPEHAEIRLSTRVYYGRTAETVAIAALEAGHAIIAPSTPILSLVRAYSRPLELYASTFFWVLFIASVLLGNVPFFLLSVVVLSVNVMVQCALLPTEFRAKRAVLPLIEECLNLDPGDRAIVIEALGASVYRGLPPTITGAFRETIPLVAHKLLR